MTSPPPRHLPSRRGRLWPVSVRRAHWRRPGWATCAGGYADPASWCGAGTDATVWRCRDSGGCAAVEPVPEARDATARQ